MATKKRSVKTDTEKLIGILEEFDRKDIAAAVSGLGLSDISSPSPSISLPIPPKTVPVILQGLLAGGVSWLETQPDESSSSKNCTVSGTRSECSGKKVKVEYKNASGDDDSAQEDSFNGAFNLTFIAKKGTTATLRCGDKVISTYEVDP